MLVMSISGEDCESDPPVPGQVVAGQYQAGGAWVITARGDLDLESLPPLRAALEAAAAAHPVVVLDVGAVTFGDSTFLGVLLAVRQLTALRVAGAGQTLLRLFSVVGADLVLDLYGSVEEALAAEPA
jgi:anti-anti-sigma factor